MLTFILVHGSWHTGKAWSFVVEHLESQGHTVYAPDGPDRTDLQSKSIQFADYVETLESFIIERDLRGFVLVGHSFGGAVVAKLSESMSDRIARLVFLSAIIPEDGHSALDEMPPAYAEGFAALAAESSDNAVFPDWALWRDIFIGDADLVLAKTAFDELVREPFGPVQEKLDLSVFYGLQIPKTYIHCTEDMVFPPGEWGWFPRMYNRLGLCRLVLAQGSHEMMYSNPENLAACLVKAGRP